MLVVVIAASRLIADGGFNTSAGLVPICGIGGNTKVVVKGKEVEASAKTGVGDAEKVLNGVLPDCGSVKDADDIANGAGTNKVVATRRSKREVCILPMLVVVISASGFIVNRCI